jgi:peptidase M23-like protein
MPAMSWRMLGRAVTATALAIVLSALAAADARGWAWPVRGRVITTYANDNGKPYAGGMHRGIDIAAPVGTVVVAARAGEVTYAGALGSAGVTVAVRTGDYATSYLHLAKASVARGDRVASGQRIGAVGTTGRRSKAAPHLHFGVRLASRERFYVDPLTLLPPLAASEGGTAPDPVPARAPARPQPARVPVRAMPLPAPEPAASHAPRPHRQPARLRHPVGLGARASVPAGPPLRDRRPARHPSHPVARPVPVEEPHPGRDFGRPLGFGGVALLFAALFGRAVLRALRDANAAFSEGLYERVGRALRAIRHAPSRKRPNATPREQYFARNR